MSENIKNPTTEETPIPGANVSLEEYLRMTAYLGDLNNKPEIDALKDDVMEFVIDRFRLNPRNDDVQEFYARLQKTMHFSALNVYADLKGKDISDYSLHDAPQEWIEKIRDAIHESIKDDPGKTVRGGSIGVANEHPKEELPDPNGMTEEEFVDEASRVVASAIGIEWDALPPDMRDMVQEKTAELYRERVGKS